MRKLLCIFLFTSIIFSCQDINRSPKPENLIPEDKMVEVLTEISLLHGARSYNKSLMEEKGIDPYPYLMDKFGIDSLQLVQSNNYYAENYKQYQRIYDGVKLRLEVLMKRYDSIREVEEKRQDSIRDLIKSDTLSKSEIDSLLQDTLRSLPEPVFRGRERRIFQDTIR